MTNRRTEDSPEARRAAEIYSLNVLLARVLRNLEPPENLTLSEWADAKRRLSKESSAEDGRYRTSRTPYIKEILDSFTDPLISDITFVAASQVGKSEVENNIVAYIMDQDPGSILFVHPTIGEAREYSKLRIAPLIRDTPCLRKKVHPSKSRDSGNTILQKSYPGGILTLTGSREAHSLASKPIRYVIGDELDRWAESAGKEGDPWLLARARQKTFYNRKSIAVSTGTIKGYSRIEKMYKDGTMERWKSECPNCHSYHEIMWEDIRYVADEINVSGTITYDVHDIFYACPECGCAATEVQMKKAPARWEAMNPAALKRGHRSFWLSAFVSPWASWKSIILEYLSAIGDPQKMQVVYNTAFGYLWEDRGSIETEESLLARREVYDAELPEGVLMLCAGVDTQDNRFEYEIVGYGFGSESWGIEKGVIPYRPDTDEAWQALDNKVFDRVLHFSDGIGMKVSMSFVDEGGHYTQTVRERCSMRTHMNVFAIKGMAGQNRPFTSPPKETRILDPNGSGEVIGQCIQYQIGVDAGKQLIMANLAVKEPGAGYCHFPQREDYGEKYFAGLLSERLVYVEGARQPWQWKKIQGHGRNEPLDLRNYANAAARIAPVNLHKVHKQLLRARGKDIDAAPDAPPRKKPMVQRHRAARKGWDNW